MALLSLDCVRLPARSNRYMETVMSANLAEDMMPIGLRIQNKRKELQNLTEVGNLTKTINSQLMELHEQLTNMTEESESIVSVSENWHNILRSIALATSTLRNYKRTDYDDGIVLPEPLIRLKIDKSTKKVALPEEQGDQEEEVQGHKEVEEEENDDHDDEV